MPLIVNFSSIHTLRPISFGLAAFSLLCDRYSHGCCARACPTIFKKLTNIAWVAMKYKSLIPTINDYKLGKINTDVFLKQFLKTFAFLLEDKLKYPDSVTDALWGRRDEFVSLRGVERREQLTKKQIALALLEDAWNAIVGFSVTDVSKFQCLLEQRKAEPIYLISNSNPLNLMKVLRQLSAFFPQVRCDINLETAEAGIPLEIGPNIFLCVSYKFGAYKTDSDNLAAKHSTSCLLQQVVSTLKLDPDKTRVISQFDKDIAEARYLGIPERNLHSAKDFYPSIEVESKYEPKACVIS